jgi:hypothetical protein
MLSAHCLTTIHMPLVEKFAKIKEEMMNEGTLSKIKASFKKKDFDESLDKYLDKSMSDLSKKET